MGIKLDYASVYHPKTNCSDQTSNSLISVHQCHPWIGNADSKVLEGFITSSNHTLITSNVSKESLLQ